jgi:hypothetical protein
MPERIARHVGNALAPALAGHLSGHTSQPLTALEPISSSRESPVRLLREVASSP